MVMFAADAYLHVLLNGKEEVHALRVQPGAAPDHPLQLSTPPDFELVVPPGATFYAWVELVGDALTLGQQSYAPQDLYTQGADAPAWRILSFDPPDRYTVSPDVEIVSHTDAQEGETRRVLDSQLLSGYTDAPPGSVPVKAEPGLKWLELLDGGNNPALRPELLPGYLEAETGSVLTRTGEGLDWQQAGVDAAAVRGIVGDTVQAGQNVTIDRAPDGTLTVSAESASASVHLETDPDGFIVLDDAPPPTIQLTQEQVDGAVSRLLTVTQDQVNAAVTPEKVQAAVAVTPITVPQAQVDAAVQGMTITPTQAQVDAGVRKLVNSGQPVVIEGLKYALPDAQPVDFPAANDASIFTSVRHTSGTNEYDLNYTSRSTNYPYGPVVADPFVPHGTQRAYRFGTTVPSYDNQEGAVDRSLGIPAGAKLRQAFALPAPFWTRFMRVTWSRATTDGLGYTVDSIYTLRLFDQSGALINTWANVNLRGQLGSFSGVTLHALPNEMMVQSGTLEIEVVSLAGTRQLGGSGPRLDINYYPAVENVPASQAGRPTATDEAGNTVQDAGIPMVLSSPTFPAMQRPIQPSVLTPTAEGVNVETRGQLLILNLPSLPRPRNARKLVLILTPTVRERLLATSMRLTVAIASLEGLQTAGGNAVSSDLIYLAREAGSETFKLGPTPLSAGARLRIEVGVARKNAWDTALTVKYICYNDQTGLKLLEGVSQLTEPASYGNDGMQIRFYLGPSISNSNVHAVDDFIIHRWTEWTE